MDENLTRREKLVKLAVDLHTVPNHHLVVFKKTGEEGREFRSTVAPGQTFKRKLLESSDSFVAYNIPCDKNLRYRFSKKVLMLDNTRSFTLHITLFYGIQDPRVVVEKVERDPLRRVQDEAVRVLAGRASRLDWSVVEEGGRAFESILWQDDSGSPDSALEQIQSFGLDQGIHVVNLGLGRSLPEDATSQPRREIKAQDRFHAENVEHALRMQKAQNEAERNELKTFSTARDAMANRAAADINSFPGMQRALQDWNKFRGSGTASGAIGQGPFGEGTPHSATLSGSSSQLALPAGGGVLPEILSSAFDQLLAVDPASRRPLFSAILHLLGELLAADENKECVSKYRDEIDRIFKAKIREFDRQQTAFLRRVLAVEDLRKDLRSW